MTEAKDIDDIDNIMDMVRTMAALGVSGEGLRTLEEMKSRVKETFKTSENKSSWTANEAFSVLAEAKLEDERKRATLHQFYEDTEVCLNTLDDKVRSPLEQNIENLKDKIALSKRNLKRKDYIVLVAGETSSGKSTLLNLILGEQLLPYSILSTTSTLCELKYGPTPKLVAHFKDKDPQNGNAERTVWLGQSVKTSLQSIRDEVSSFVHVKTQREKGSDYKKIELFWPHSLLKQGIIVVDSPGVGESKIMDEIVKEYLQEAFAFIFVINSANAGGIQEDRVEKLFHHARNVSLGQLREPSARALFVCNKWDQVPPEEADEVKNYITEKLTQCWPSLDPDSQIIFMSSTNAHKAQGLGIISDQFASLMDSIKSMVLKSIEASLHSLWRRLDYLLSRIAYHLRAFIVSSYKGRSKVIERMTFITERLEKIEKLQISVNKELQEYLENQTEHAVSALSKYLKSSEVVEQFTSWTLDDVPNTGDNWKETAVHIEVALKKRFRGLMVAWEREHHVFADARTFLGQYVQERLNLVEGQLQSLERSVIANNKVIRLSIANFAATTPDNDLQRIILGAAIPIWVPVALVALIVSLPFFGAIALGEKLVNWSKLRKYEGDKCGFMANASKEFLTEAAEEQNLRSYVEEQLKESQVFLKQVVSRIPMVIEADKMLFKRLRYETQSKKEIEDFYKPLYERSLKLRERMASFGIKEVRTMDISCRYLEWNDDASSLLGTGAFAFVYRGTLKRQGEQPVALKVWKDELNDSNASIFLAEAETLRKLIHPFIVKFYGAALQKEGDHVRGILVMELCKEDLMRHILKNPKNIPAMPSSTPPTYRNTIRWARDITDALKYIHKQGLVHRDLKLENILISSEDVVKIADVGVCKEAKMITGTMTGTPAYVAPEVIKYSVYDFKADIYSFGIMMWEMWYGKRALLQVGGDTLFDSGGRCKTVPC